MERGKEETEYCTMQIYTQKAEYNERTRKFLCDIEASLNITLI
jgi:hypothetical protein